MSSCYDCTITECLSMGQDKPACDDWTNETQREGSSEAQVDPSLYEMDKRHASEARQLAEAQLYKLLDRVDDLEDRLAKVEGLLAETFAAIMRIGGAT
jgi:hypothetical protein